MLNAVVATSAIASSVIAVASLAATFSALSFVAGCATVSGLFFVWRKLGQLQPKDESWRSDAPPVQDTVPVQDAEYPVPVHVEDQLVQDVVNSLFEIHHLMFRSLVDGDDRELFDTVEGEIERNGFEIINPDEGDELDGSIMVTTRQVECPSDDKADRVASVDQCGFRPSEGFGWDAVEDSVFKKCHVAVYRRVPARKEGTDT